MIDSGDFIGASEAMLTLSMEDSDSQFNKSRLKKLAVGLLQANMPDDAEIYLEEYIERFPDNAAWARVQLAQLLLVRHKRPSAALAQLKQVRPSQLTEDQRTAARKTAAAAKKQIRAGVQGRRTRMVMPPFWMTCSSERSEEYMSLRAPADDNRRKGVGPRVT